MGKFNIEDVNIGDSVYFRLDGVQNHNSFWTVKSKFSGSKLEVEADKFKDSKSKRFIDIHDVIKIRHRTTAPH